MLDKYGSRGFVVLSINVDNRYDKVVAPFVRNSGYGFVPVRGSRDWASSAYAVEPTPANILVDPRGRVVFRLQVHDAEDEATAGLAIEALLEAHRGT